MVACFVVVQSLSVRFFVTPWTAACQAYLSFTISWNLLKLMSIEPVMPSNHLVLCHPLLLLPSISPSIRVFSNESAMSGQSIGSSALVSVLLMWFPLGLTGLISLQSKGLSRVFCSTTIQKLKFFGAQPPLWSLRCAWSNYKIVRNLWEQPSETLLMPPQLPFLYSSFNPLWGGDARNPLPSCLCF